VIWKWYSRAGEGAAFVTARAGPAGRGYNVVAGPAGLGTHLQEVPLMSRIMILGLLFVLPVLPIRAADEPDPEPVPPDIKRLQGEWEIVSIARGGRVVQNVAGRGWTMTLEKTRMTMSIGGKGRTGTWKIDARKNPKHIDMTGNVFAGNVGVYKLDKDDLTIGCNNGNARPKDIASAQLTLVLKRKKK
jgi:uncharacterized protein (TIGR03067 family)